MPDVWFNRGTTAYDLYVHSLQSQYMNGYRIWDPSYALANDPLAYEKLDKDPVIFHAKEIRKQRVAGNNWTLEPGGEAPADVSLAKVLEKLIRKIRNFIMARANLAEAFMKGSQFQRIAGRREFMMLGDGLTPAIGRMWWVPKELRDVSRMRFIAKPIRAEDGSYQTEWQMWNMTSYTWEKWEHPEWYVKHKYDLTEETLGYGRGLIDTIYYYWRAKEVVMEQGLAGLERWANGILTAKVDGARDAATDKPNTAVVEDWVNALQVHRSRHVIVYDKQDEIQVLTGGMEGHQMVQEWLRYLDNSITRSIVYSILPTGGDSGSGSLARAETESDTMEGGMQFDRELLSDTLTDDLVKLVYNLNVANLGEIGLSGAEMPKFAIVHQKMTDPLKEVQVATTAISGGIDLPRSEVYRRIGYPEPKPGDEVFAGRQAAPNPFGGDGGFGGFPGDKDPEDKGKPPFGRDKDPQEGDPPNEDE